MTQIDGGGTCSSISAQLYIHKSLIAGEPNALILPNNASPAILSPVQAPVALNYINLFEDEL